MRADPMGGTDEVNTRPLECWVSSARSANARSALFSRVMLIFEITRMKSNGSINFYTSYALVVKKIQKKIVA